MSEKPAYTRFTYLFCAVLLLIFSAGRFCSAMEMLGAPVAGQQMGSFDIGGGFTYSVVDLSIENGKWKEYVDGVFDSQGRTIDFTIEDFKTSNGYSSISFGVTDYVEAFARMGGSKAWFGDSIWEDSEEFDSDTELAFGVGLKVTFFEQENLKLGGLFNVDTVHYDGQLNARHWAASGWAPDYVDIRLAQFKLAVGADYMLMEGFSVYGGPYVHFIDGRMDDETYMADSEGALVNTSYHWDIKEDSVFGGYIGAKAELAGIYFLAFEFQHTASADTAGLSLGLRF